MMAHAHPLSFKTAVAFAVVLVIAFFAGWRDWGVDRDNYVVAYFGIVGSETIAEKMFFAKDVMLFFLVSISSYFGDDPKLSFLLVCTIALYAKLFAMRRIMGDQVLFFVLVYVFFISPGLEFAAMRAGLAIGFLMLMLAYSDSKLQRIIWPVLVIFSHTSLLPIIIAAQPKAQRFFVKWPILYLLIVLVTPLSVPIVLSFFQKWAYYEDSQGTIYSLLTPILTLLTAIEIFRQRTGHIDDTSFYVGTKHLSLLLISMAFGIAVIIPAASTRYLEVAWCLMLPIAIMEKRHFGLCLLIVLLAYINISRLTWIAVVDPSVVS